MPGSVKAGRVFIMVEQCLRPVQSGILPDCARTKVFWKS